MQTECQHNCLAGNYTDDPLVLIVKFEIGDLQRRSILGDNIFSIRAHIDAPFLKQYFPQTWHMVIQQERQVCYNKRETIH